jgi:hypothetical protein
MPDRGFSMARRRNAPSWNYNRAEGDGIELNMMAHWRYMIDTFEKQTDQIALPFFKPTGSK